MSEQTPVSRWHLSAFMRRFLLGVAVLMGVLAVLFAVLVYSASARLFAMRTALNAMDAAPAADEAGITNILLLGVGDRQHDGADLTDTMILASIDPGATRSVVMLSVPRDLFLEPGRTSVSGRVNAVYANEKYRLRREGMEDEEASQEAMKAVAAEMSEKLGVPVHGVIKADFTAFTEVVDAIGGVEVDVPERIVDYTYPVAEGRTGLFEIDAGMQLLDGETALRYARSRHSTNDFDRSARQQQLLSAIAYKMRGLGRLAQIRFLSSLYERLQGHVETTIPLPELMGLAQIGTDLSLDRVITMQLNFNAGGDYSDAQPGGFVYPAPPELFEGASILLPVALPGRSSDWSQIRTLASFLVDHRSAYLERPDIVITDMGASPLQAHRLRNELSRYGWTMLEIQEPDEALPEPPADSFVYYRDDAYENSASFIGNLLGLPVARATDSEAGSGHVLILLGTEFGYKPFQTLSGAVLGDKMRN